MPFFLNPFTNDFSGMLLLGDRQYNVDWNCPRNSGRGDENVIVWAEGPYDLSGNDADGNAKNVLTISFALNDYKNWSDLPVTISGASLSAITPQEIATSLLSDVRFADFFTVSTANTFKNGKPLLLIKQIKPQVQFKFYIKRGQADTVLKFNARAGIAEMPTYFDRHTIANRFTYTNSENQLIQLDPATSNVDAALIDAAVDARGVPLNYDSGTVRADYQLLRGRSGLFTFRTAILDGTGRVETMIEYPAGALAGDLAKKTTYAYDGANTTPITTAEVPYTLLDSDLVTPP